MTPKPNLFTVLNAPMTARRNTIFTGLMAAMMMFLLVDACILSQWWPMLVVLAVYVLSTIWIIYLQVRHPESGQLMRMVFVMPSCLMGILAMLLALVMKNGPNALMFI